MPAISMFLGIIIYMYIDDHNPPHFHAKYQGCEGMFDLEGNMIEGNIPFKQQKFIVAWAALHDDELQANWQIASEKGDLFRIDPLR